MSDVWARFVGTMEVGKFRPDDPERFVALKRGWEGRRIEVALCPERVKRTLPQNAKLHVIARVISDSTGDTLDNVKATAVYDSLGPEAALRKISLHGTEAWIVRGTSTLHKDECSKVMDWMLDKLAFLEIPEPNWDEIEVMQ